MPSVRRPQPWNAAGALREGAGGGVGRPEPFLTPAGRLPSVSVAQLSKSATPTAVKVPSSGMACPKALLPSRPAPRPA